MTEEELRAELERTRKALADQALELQELRAEPRRDEAAAGLLAATAAGGADAGSQAHQELLDLIVRTAASALEAEAASLFLLDDEAQELVFQVAIGGSDDMLRGQRIPLGTGIVGFVAATGSHLTSNSVREDPRFAASFAESTGYVPENILAVPLIDDGDVVGVLEALNKRRGKEGFGTRDIEVLSLFANQAAVALRRSIAGRDMVDALKAVVEHHAAEGQPHEMQRNLAPFALRLTELIRDIGSRGERERKMLLAIVEAVHEYASGGHPDE